MSENNKKPDYELFTHLIETFDEGCALTKEYDALLHDYNGVVLYQAESQLIKIIGNQEGITVSEIARLLHKTVSACSQLIRKLRKKGWVCQSRNKENNREYNLYLTDEGKIIYQKHHDFESKCYQRTFHALHEFTAEQLETYISIQNAINATFRLDVLESSSLEINAK